MMIRRIAEQLFVYAFWILVAAILVGLGSLVTYIMRDVNQTHYPQTILPYEYERDNVRTLDVGDTFDVPASIIYAARDGRMFIDGEYSTAISVPTYYNLTYVTIRRSKTGVELLERSIGIARWERSNAYTYGSYRYLPLVIVEKFD